MGIPMLLAALAVAMAFVGSSVPRIGNVPIEVRPGVQASFAIAKDVWWSKRVLLGTGPGTYGIAYALHRPQEVNATDFWSFRFNQGYNVPLTLAVTMGLVGLLAYGFVLYAVGKRFARSGTDDPALPLLAGLLFILVAWLMHPASLTDLVFFIAGLGGFAGKHGGTVTFSGTMDELKKSDTSLTGQFLSGKRRIDLKKTEMVKNRGVVKLVGAKQHNLKNVDIEFPLGNLIAITGVSGSGKSTLITETLYPALKYHIDGYYSDTMGDFQRLEGFHYVDRVYMVDQSPIGRTPRSNPATYVGFFDDVRELFATTQDAKARGFEKGRFSFNIKGGRCEKCQGAGVIKIEMQFMADMYITCDVCKGRRYNLETLEVLYKGMSIDQILKMTVDEAADFFKNHPHIYTKLSFLQHVGLGYITLGQQAPTFSGGEAQRIKLANELSRKSTGKTLYILDEPTTGLHFYDIEKLLFTLQELVDRGNTVVVIEHNLDVIRHAQYIVDMGPEGGDAGGNVVYQGAIEGIKNITISHTGRYLAPYLL
jgi:excinuclease ABC subunit A